MKLVNKCLLVALILLICVGCADTSKQEGDALQSEEVFGVEENSAPPERLITREACLGRLQSKLVDVYNSLTSYTEVDWNDSISISEVEGLKLWYIEDQWDVKFVLDNEWKTQDRKSYSLQEVGVLPVLEEPTILFTFDIDTDGQDTVLLCSLHGKVTLPAHSASSSVIPANPVNTPNVVRDTTWLALYDGTTIGPSSTIIDSYGRECYVFSDPATVSELTLQFTAYKLGGFREGGKVSLGQRTVKWSDTVTVGDIITMNQPYITDGLFFIDSGMGGFTGYQPFGHFTFIKRDNVPNDLDVSKPLKAYVIRWGFKTDTADQLNAEDLKINGVSAYDIPALVETLGTPAYAHNFHYVDASYFDASDGYAGTYVWNMSDGTWLWVNCDTKTAFISS